MTNQDPNNPEDYLRKLQEGAANDQGVAPTDVPPTEPYGQGSYGQAPYGQAPYGQAPYGQAPYGQGSYGGPAPYQPPMPGTGFPGQVPAHPNATTSMVLGIVGLASIAIACGLGLFVSPVAWMLGSRAVREIDANPGRLSGRENANAGRIMGIIGTVLLGLGILLVLAFAALMFSSGTTTSYSNV